MMVVTVVGRGVSLGGHFLEAHPSLCISSQLSLTFFAWHGPVIADNRGGLLCEASGDGDEKSY